ncbi:uncharacterized protein LACBIDRAFT_317644 [Laccaria bicolor S238N-H82]|nr:uncharacterized protein LACBIDRAFT_317644 [Laccaria bicolor S238N-H82]EDQ99107.1 predicted protein [Laccaria bicolor S238N-H82]|eukprot:XP_001890240.1 predicted protein [Laccaria bicolor S238N-H82]
MHALDLNLIQNHLRLNFQIDPDTKGGDGTVSGPWVSKDPLVSSKNDIKALDKCQKLVQENHPKLLYKLLDFNRKVLYTFCVEHDVKGPGHTKVVGTRWVLARNIHHWRQGSNPELLAFLSSALTMDGSTTEANDEGVTAANGPRSSTEAENIEQTGESDQESAGPHSPRGEENFLDEEPETVDTGVAADDVDPKRVARVIRHLIDKDDLEGSRKKAYTYANNPVLIYLCELLGIDHGHVNLKKRNTAKSQLFQAVISAIDNNPENTAKLSSTQPEVGSRAVLGSDVMEAVWEDMAFTQLPSWVGLVPRNWGTAKRGKLTADNWRVICTVHLPITLIRLWKDETGRKAELLQNFMDLATAVRIANMRVSSKNQVRAYNFHISRYASALPTLFPDVSIKPTVHAALHLGDIMDLFGPVHSHSAPFYERYIYFLQQLNTNKKLGAYSLHIDQYLSLIMTPPPSLSTGDLETTFMKVSSRTANLRAILADDEAVRQNVMELVKSIKAIEQEDIRGFRLASMLDPTLPDYADSSLAPFTLSGEPYQLLCGILGSNPLNGNAVRPHAEAFSLNRIARRGVSYGTCASPSFRDSAIIFRGSSSVSPHAHDLHKTGRIEKIFQHVYQGIKTFYLVVREHQRIDPSIDPYVRFGFAGGYLCEKVPRLLHLIMLEQVVSHFAMTNLRSDGQKYLIHALPIDRLMLSFKLSEDIHAGGTNFSNDEQTSTAPVDQP